MFEHPLYTDTRKNGCLQFQRAEALADVLLHVEPVY